MKLIIINKYMYLKDRVRILSTEKKYVFLLLSVALILTLYFLLVWYPLNNAIQSLKEENDRERDILLSVTIVGNEIVQLKIVNKKNKRAVSIPLLTLIDKEAKKNSWAGYPLQLKGLDNNRVEVSFQSIAFDDLLGGLTQIWTLYNIDVLRISVHRTSNESSVSANFILK